MRSYRIQQRTAGGRTEYRIQTMTVWWPFWWTMRFNESGQSVFSSEIEAINIMEHQVEREKLRLDRKRGGWSPTKHYKVVE